MDKDINLETCSGIRELADRLTSKMHGFVELGPGDISVSKDLPLYLRTLLHSLADRLESDSAPGEIAGAVFDILNALDTASEGFALVVDHVNDHVNMLRCDKKGKIARGGKSAILAERDAEIFRQARAHWNLHREGNSTIAKAILEKVNEWIAKRLPADGKRKLKKAESPMKADAVSKVLNKESYWKPN